MVALGIGVMILVLSHLSAFILGVMYFNHMRAQAEADDIAWAETLEEMKLWARESARREGVANGGNESETRSEVRD